MEPWGDSTCGRIPAEPGSYVLRMKLPAALRIVVGRLGAFDFPAGDYLYLGSACGPGGLRGRLGHHLRLAGRPHWHIDYLRRHTGVLGGWYSLDPRPLECAWGQSLRGLPGALFPVMGFGAADCQNRCPAHLLAFPQGLPVNAVVERLCACRTGQVTVLAFAAENVPDPANHRKIE